MKKNYLFLIFIVLFFFLTIILFEYLITPRNESINKPTKNNPVINTPEQFGANGYDEKPDTKALQEAIDKSDILLLKSGATYIIDEPLVSNHTIEIKSDNQTKTPPIILQSSMDSAFVFENKPKFSTKVSEPIYQKDTFVVLNNTKGISPGDLIHLKSSTLWPDDNRGYLKKGELQKVLKVEGNKVYFERPMADEYKIDKTEQITAKVYPKLTLKLSNITFSHPEPYNTVMIDINYASDSIIKNLFVRNSKHTGIILNNTYNTKVSKVNINLGTTKDINTGYGIMDYGGTGTLVTESKFINVRRGVDFSGGTPSRYGKVTDSRAVGFKPDTLAGGNSGFGTHSTAEYISFENNTIENFNYAFLVRGNNVSIIGNSVEGSTRNFIYLSFGDNIKLENNTYDNKGVNSLNSFIMLSPTYKGSIIAKKNTILGLKGPLINGDLGMLNSLSLSGNIVKP
ncbi:hypothetical protein WQ57_07345 [Mesobacillus campisalis]|uniref:Right handed beta helix domain-containing protein n=1 Tax=Mesobacillus campisalis TaxID=1408103 RepID=A0A0M2SYK2_9BACI|nr:hypothetical protein [Mesobacillus campisalis]KKK38786.1 hypothetical protein WQ57_07345 [Mesobacillus campisalis]